MRKTEAAWLVAKHEPLQVRAAPFRSISAIGATSSLEPRNERASRGGGLASDAVKLSAIVVAAMRARTSAVGL